MNKARIALAALAGIMAVPLAAQTQAEPPPLQGGDDPIVPDSAFEEALPPLDPALSEPLEPIDPNLPPFPPVPGPVEDLPLGDPALAEPLPPISSFDVQPVEEAALTEDEQEAARIRYSVEVIGSGRLPAHPR